MRTRMKDKRFATAPWDEVIMGSIREIKNDEKRRGASTTGVASEDRKKQPYKEVQRIVSSIPSLNNCIDKQFFQRKVNKLNPDEHHQIETNIANEIIKDYEKEKRANKTSRLKFLRTKSEDTISRIRETSKRQEKVKVTTLRVNEAKRKVKMYSKIVSNLEQGRFTERPENNEIFERLYEERKTWSKPKNP